MTTKRVTYFSLRTRTDSCVRQHSYKAGRGDGERKERKWRSRKIEIKARKKFLAVHEACVARFWPNPGFKGRAFVYHCRELPQVSKHVFCRDRSMLVATNVLLRQTHFDRDKTFISKNIILSRQAYFGRDKRRVLLRQKWYLWQLPPMIFVSSEFSAEGTLISVSGVLLVSWCFVWNTPLWVAGDVVE